MEKVGDCGSDMIFCAVCLAVVFLCALAVDKGRLRFFQAGLHLLGAFSVIWRWILLSLERRRELKGS